MPTIQEIVGTIIRGEQVLKFPLKAENRGTWIADANGNHIADIRGWGYLQYHSEGSEKAAELQDAIGCRLVEMINSEARRLGLDTL